MGEFPNFTGLLNAYVLVLYAFVKSYPRLRILGSERRDFISDSEGNAWDGRRKTVVMSMGLPLAAIADVRIGEKA
jgi:hypothetical protein